MFQTQDLQLREFLVIRQDENGAVIKDGVQIQIGGNETYVSLCRRHWREAIGDFDKI